MNSAVKQYPRPLSGLTGLWALLSSLLVAALPAFGQGSAVNQTGSIRINDAQFVAGSTIPAKATPYPSSIGISNQFVGVIQKAAVVLPGLSHEYANDIDLLLVTPSGQKIVLMSDVALNGVFNGTEITIDADAANSFPTSLTPGAAVPGGSYKPANLPPDDVFTDVAGPYDGSLANLVGVVPEGTWQLYAIDDKFEHAGTISGWSLKLWTTPVFGAVTNLVRTLENIPVTFPVTFDDSDNSADSVIVRAVATDKNLVSDTNITVTATGKTRNVTVTPNLNRNGSTTLTITVNDGRTTISSNINLTIGEVNQPPTIALSTNRVEALAGSFSATAIATVADVDAASLDDISIFAGSSNTNVVPTNFVADVTRVGGTRTLVVAPIGTATGTVDLQLFARDAGTSNNISGPAALSFTIKPVTQALFSYPSNLVIPDNNTVVSQTVNVSNVLGNIGKITATLNGVTHANPADLQIRLKSPGNAQQALLLSANGGDTDVVGTWLTLDDAAANPLPSILNPGTYRPSEPLSVFNDISANGAWTLEVQDTTAGPASPASIRGGVTLRIFTKPQVIGLANTNLAENTSKQISFAVGDFDGQVTNLTVSTSNSSLLGVAVALNGTSGVLTLTGKPDQNGSGTVTVTAQDDSGFTQSQTITVVVNAVNTPPNISPIAKQLTYAGQPLGPIEFTVDDTGASGTATDETPAGNIVVTARSNNQKLVPDGNIILGGTGGTRNFTIYPIGNKEDTVTITLTATDTGVPAPGLSRTLEFLFQVLEPASPLEPNSTPIIIADSGVGNGATNAAPYPSSITMADKIGLIRQIQVTLVGVKHPNPQDIGVLLVGPSGEKVVLMSGAGGTTPISGTQLVFTDSAAGALSSVGPIISGTYRPSNLNGRTAADFPGTGSAQAVSSSLSVFNGRTINGTWSLYVRDFTGNTKGDGQEIANGWMINFVTDANLAAIPTQETDEDVAKRVNLVIGDNQPGKLVTLTATSDNTTLIPNANLKFEPGVVAQANHALIVTPATNQNGTANITVTAVVDGGTPSTRSFLMRVNAVNDIPTITGNGTTDREKPAGFIDGPRLITVRDEESPANSIVVRATSNNPSVVPSENIVLRPYNDGSGNWDITILPNGIQTGEARITLSAQVGSERSGDVTFAYRVLRNKSYLSNIDPNSGSRRIEIADNATGRPYPSITRVTDLPGLISKVSVTLLGFGHTFPEDADILLVSPDNKKVLLMTDAGGGAPTNSVSGLTLTFDDAGTDLAARQKLENRTYKPANFGSGQFPQTPSEGALNTTLSAFNGSSPNGEWKLYVVDDTFSDAGEIANGWILIIETAPRVLAIGTQTTREDTALSVEFTIEDGDTEAKDLRTWAMSANESLVNNTNLVISPTNTFTRTLAITPTRNAHGTNRVTVYVADNSLTTSNSFDLVILPVDDPPVITSVTNLVRVNEDVSATISFQVFDVDSVLSVTNASVVSSDPSVVPSGTNGLVLTGPVSIPVATSTNVLLSVTPARNASGESRLSFGITDGTTLSTFGVTFAVTEVNDAPTISVTNNTYSITAGQTLAGIPVSVRDVETPGRNLEVRAVSRNASVIPNTPQNLALSGVDGDRLLSVTPVGTEPASVVIDLYVKDSANVETSTNITINVTRAPGRAYANSTSITIRDAATSSPYGTTINVPALEGNISDISVTLDVLNHTSPDDLDVLLVSPTGKKILLLSDAGGTVPVNNARLVFQDGASEVPDNGPLVGGTYRPTNYGEGDVLPSPAPAGPYASSLSEVLNTDPQGIWTLYIYDDTTGGTGTLLGGWALKIVTTPLVTTTTGSPLVWDEDNQATVTLVVNDLDTGSKFDQLEPFASSSNEGLINSGRITYTLISANPNSDGGPWTVLATLTPTANTSGTNLLTIGYRRKSDRAASSVTLANTVTLINDAPTISRITERSTDENTPVTIEFLVEDVDTSARDLSIRATSGDQVLISDNRLRFFGETNFLSALPSSTLSLTLLPNTNRTGTAAITLLVTDNSTNSPARTATTTFNLVVRTFNDPPTITDIPDITLIAGDSSTNIAFSVADVDSATVRLSATSSRQSLVKDSNIRISTDAAGTVPATGLLPVGNRWIRVTSEVAQIGTTVIAVVAEDAEGRKSTNEFNVTLSESRERVVSNSTPIVIRDNSSASLYPSTITVSNLVADVSRVRVRLNGFAHSFPEDADVLLVSPSGRTVMLMSDAGGGTSVTNLTLTFSDSGDEEVPRSSTLTSKTYRPRNHDPAADPLPAPAPSAPFGTTLGSLAGTTANGVWQLFVVDDTSSDSGFINGGWELMITTQPRIVGLANVSTQEGGTFRVPFSILEESEFANATFELWSTSTNSAVVRTNDITFSGSGTNWTLAGKAVDFASGVSKITVFARNPPYNQVVSSDFLVTVSSFDDPPTISPVPDLQITAGTASSPISFSYSDPETQQKDLVLTRSTTNPELIPTNNIFINGGLLYVAPVGNRTGVAEITLSVSDGNTNRPPTQETFVVTVVPPLNAQFANSSAIVVSNTPGVGRANPYPSTIEVSRLNGLVARVSVTLAEFSHKYPSDVDILLVGPKGQKVTIMSDAGGSLAVTNARYTFDDQASGQIPFTPTSATPSGNYRPSNYQGADDFPDAPAGTVGATLESFAGTDPNGTWSLYVVDDAAPDGLVIAGGWILNLFTTEPTISAIADQETLENQAKVIQFTIADADSASSNLTVVASSDNQVLLGDRNLVVSGTTNQRTLTVTPTAFASGSGVITLTVTDERGSQSSTSFTMTVLPVNQAPQITGLTDAGIPSNVTLVQDFSVFDQETAPADLVVTATISRPNFGTVDISGASADRKLTFRSSGAEGEAFISVDVSDGTTNTVKSIKVTVGPAYVLTISEIPDQNMVENESPRTIGFTVGGSESGAITGSASADNTVLVRSVVVSGAGTNRNVVIVLNSNQSGESQITVQVTDERGGVGTETFKLTVARGNKPPVIAPIAPQTTRPNVPVIIPLVVTDEDTPSTQWVFTSTISDTTLIRNVVFGLNSTGGFVATVNPVRDAVGSTTITVHVSDGFNRVSQAFPITVIENPPTLGPIADQTTVANQPIEIVLSVQDLDTPITELVYSATSSNPSLIAGVTFDTTGGIVKATINLVTDATGVATVTISVRDSATTVSQVFAVAVNTAAAPQFAAPTLTTNPDGSKTITVTWQNGGELEWAESAAGPWTATGNTTGTYSEPATASARLFRIKR